MNRKLKITAALLLLGALAAVASVLGWVASARRPRLAPMARADAGRAWITNAVNAVRPLSLSRAQVGRLTMTPTTTRLLAAMGATLVALLVFTPRSAPAFNSNSTATVTSAATTVAAAPPNSGRRMHWFRSHTAARSLDRRAARFGSTAVIGLESMHDLASLRQSYGFETVQAMPALRAARVHVDDAELHALLAHAPGDRRVRYVSAVGPPRRVRTCRAIRSCRTWIPRRRSRTNGSSRRRTSAAPSTSRRAIRGSRSASLTPALTPCPISQERSTASTTSLRTERSGRRRLPATTTTATARP